MLEYPPISVHVVHGLFSVKLLSIVIVVQGLSGLYHFPFVVVRRRREVWRELRARENNSNLPDRILRWTCDHKSSSEEPSSAANHSFMVAERGYIEQLRSSGLAKALVEEAERLIKWCRDSCCCRRQRRDPRPLGQRTIADRVRDSKLYPPR